MTREEAIKLLVNATYSDEWQGNEDLTTAYNMAIKALEQEPCEDSVSRQEVINTIFEECSGEKLDIDFAKVLLLQRKIKALPSATPERKKGRWIVAKNISGRYTIECSSCHKKWQTYDVTSWRNECKKENKFCFNCGSEMEGE